MELKIKWIKRKQMTHENTFRDDKQLEKGSTRVFFYFDKTTEQVTIIQLVTILLIYKVLQHQDESFLLTCIV